MSHLPNIHPGEILLEEFLKPMQISQNALARSIDVPPRRINEIVLGKRAISADTAVRLSRAFGTSARFWLGLQADHDLEEAQLKLGGALDEIDCITDRLDDAELAETAQRRLQDGDMVETELDEL